MSFYISAIRQIFPGKPTYTEKDIPDLAGKVYLVTGANTGVGREVAQILFSKNAVVWAAARNEEKGRNAIQSIREAHPESTGRLEFLHLDLSDLTTIKKSAETFLSKEKKLHVLFNNAGVMMPPQGSKSPQGYELQIATNNLGPFLFTKLLTPTLAETAKVSPEGSVRVIWVSSSAAETIIPVKGGIDLGNLDYKKDIFYAYKYGVSKVGNYYHSTEYARRHRKDGIVSLSLNPGNLKTDLDRYCNAFEMIFRKLTVYPAVNGAYTELFAGLSNEVTLEKSGGWIVPWGRFSGIRTDVLQGSKPQSEGGTGIAEKFWEWTEEQVKPYM
ncbi:short-chain dehydrogenase [Hypoxylon sp. FL0890]|nr:short-chain dehydrogenase [Hypoxylon sp. FL0890]